MYHRNYSFKWDLEGVKESPLKKISIMIEGVYGWGTGYLVNSRVFENQAYPELKKLGTIIPDKMDIACPTLMIKGSPKGVYLHPMEFTGYMTIEDAEKIKNILKSCNCVTNVQINIDTDKVYELTPSKYDKLMTKHSKEILTFLDEAENKGVRYDYGFEFAENFRLLTPYTSAARSSSDPDVAHIDKVVAMLSSLKIKPCELLLLIDSKEIIKQEQANDDHELD